MNTKTPNSPPRHEVTKKPFFQKSPLDPDLKPIPEGADSPPGLQGAKKTRIPPIPEATDRVGSQIVDAAYQVHVNLGPGLLESVYEVCLVYELRKRGLKVERQVVLPVVYDGLQVETGLRLDIVVQECIVVKLKAVEEILPVHKAQVLTCLKLSRHRLGFLINFNVHLVRSGIFRIAL
jgi:GxxExxY protein